MIITSSYELEVGKIIIPQRIMSEGKELKPQPLFIIRKATKEEFLEENPRDIGKDFENFEYFYEVSTDLIKGIFEGRY